jgi:hypothetical protein
MFKKYTKENLSTMDNGFYIMKSDPNSETVAKNPNDEIVELINGQIINDIKLDISNVNYELIQLKGDFKKLPHNGGGPIKFELNGKIVDIDNIKSSLK